jgi:hypothetical protein
MRVFGKVRTPDGIGVLISVSTPANGLFFSPDRAEVTVWYGVDNAQGGWVIRTYDISSVRDLDEQGAVSGSGRNDQNDQVREGGSVRTKRPGHPARTTRADKKV